MLKSRISPARKGSKACDANGLSSQPESRVGQDYVPRTKLGRRLWRIRQRILQSGQPLLDWAAIENEVRERRGETAEEGKP